MSEETRITVNPLSRESRITADLPSEVDTRICLAPLPKEEANRPKLSHPFWGWVQVVDRLLKQWDDALKTWRGKLQQTIGRLFEPNTSCQPNPSSQFWKWLPWLSFLLSIVTVVVNLAAFQMRASYRQSLIEIQQNQVKIDELKKEAGRLKPELEERK